MFLFYNFLAHFPVDYLLLKPPRVFNCSNEVHSNHCKRVGLVYANFSHEGFAFFLELSLTSQVYVLHF